MAEAKTTKRTTKTATTAATAPAKAEKKAPAKRATTAVKKPAATKATPAAAKTTAKKAAPAKKPLMDADFRMRLINDTAYYISEKRCSIATAEDDWMFAELLIDSVAFAVSQK
jgi:hypothetical protein